MRNEIKYLSSNMKNKCYQISQGNSYNVERSKIHNGTNLLPTASSRNPYMFIKSAWFTLLISEFIKCSPQNFKFYIKMSLKFGKNQIYEEELLKRSVSVSRCRIERKKTTRTERETHEEHNSSTKTKILLFDSKK